MLTNVIFFLTGERWAERVCCCQWEWRARCVRCSALLHRPQSSVPDVRESPERCGCSVSSRPPADRWQMVSHCSVFHKLRKLSLIDGSGEVKSLLEFGQLQDNNLKTSLKKLFYKKKKLINNKNMVHNMNINKITFYLDILIPFLILMNFLLSFCFEIVHTIYSPSGHPRWVSSSKQIWRNLALHHFLTNGSSALNGCHQNESSNSW